MTAPRYAIIRSEPHPCYVCGRVTLFACMACSKPTCPLCTNSMHAMCHGCREAYDGPIWELGKRADTYIRERFDRLFA